MIHRHAVFFALATTATTPTATATTLFAVTCGRRVGCRIDAGHLRVRIGLRRFDDFRRHRFALRQRLDGGFRLRLATLAAFRALGSFSAVATLGAFATIRTLAAFRTFGCFRTRCAFRVAVARFTRFACLACLARLARLACFACLARFTSLTRLADFAQ
ncbi:hypothetical protein, partial [Caballeronia zhejiangensis]|uniref:hypothetical protein n=1 Tax=Caballeronia zhejiangensis TaxID=871203 RepID=UPI001F4D0A9A